MPPAQLKRLDVPGGVNDGDISSEYDFPRITPLHSMFLRTVISRRSLRENEATAIVQSLFQNYPQSTQARGNIPLSIIEQELNESLKNIRYRTSVLDVDENTWHLKHLKI